MLEQERAILATAHQDYDAAFAQLFELYCNDIYSLALSAALYNEEAAWQLTHDTFLTAYKYFHTFQPQQGSFRLYLFSLLTTQLQQQQQRIPSTHDILPKKLQHQFSPAELAVWQAVQALPPQVWLVTELWHGANMSVPELSSVLQCSLPEVQQLQAEVGQRLRRAMPGFLEHLEVMYHQCNAYATFSKAKRVRLLRIILERKRLGLTFIHYTWRERLLQPTTLGGILICGILAITIVAAVWYREPLRLAFSEQTVPTTESVSAFLQATITKRRPSITTIQGLLPDVTTDRESLVELTGALYGTDYTFDHTFVADTDSLQPELTFKFTAEDYIPVDTAYLYTLPEALTEDQLQYAALRHFVSLPLNQFTYVNGTYYIADDPEEYRPLFIAFNNSGSIDFQMRQAAICALDHLAEPIADTQAQSNGYDFLLSHHFVEVTTEDLSITQVSAADRTVTKDAFCQDGDTKVVQDREIVYYLPHTLMRFGEGHDDVLPLRQRGMAVQLHGKHVTNVRLDALFLLLQYAERGDSITLKPFSQALTELQQYQYPSDVELAEAQRNAQVFSQWNHSHGSNRFKNMTLDTVRLEYVYDELNHLLEPYYVFNGFGTDLNDKVVAGRWYVVASSQAIELRAPYRE